MQDTQQHDAVDVFVGVDVGKGQHHAVALDRNGKRAIRTDNGKEFCSRAMLTWAPGDVGTLVRA